MQAERELIQLPNKDLWRGYNPEVVSPDNVDGTASPIAKIDQIMEGMLKRANGMFLVCDWCGQQHESATMRTHIKDLHPTVLNPPNVGELALAAATLNKV